MTTSALLNAAEKCERRVLKAEWAGEPHNYYCVMLECGHRGHYPEQALISPALCLLCLKEKMGWADDKDKDA